VVVLVRTGQDKRLVKPVVNQTSGKTDMQLFRQQKVYYQNSDGQRVPPSTPRATNVRKSSQKWYSKIKDPQTGKWRAAALSTDKGVFQKMLAKIMPASDGLRTGVISYWNQRQADAIEDSIPPWLKQMAEDGDAEPCIHDMVRLVRAICDESGLTVEQ
jgi:hypothetical protein